MKTFEQQRHFFETFGYLVLPGLLKDDIDWITSEFEAVFTDKGVQHDGSQRTCIVPFADQRERLCTLLDHPTLVPHIKNLIGDDFNYLGGDGNYYTGDTGWHSDGFHSVGQYLKVAFYLDPVTRDTGALRVIPGSHLIEAKPHWHRHSPGDARSAWGIEQNQVPSIALESQPGDVVMFNHNLYHSAFGGHSRRRMFTLNCCRHCDTPEEIADLEAFINSNARFWIESTHGEAMVRTASAERLKHLAQVREYEVQLPALVANARATMSEPARG